MRVPLLARPLQTVLALAATAVLAACAALEQPIGRPEVSVGNVRVVGMSLADVQLAFDLDVRNPNPVGVSLRGLSYRLAVQDRPLFDGNQPNRLKIGANGASRVTLPVTLRFEDVLGSLAALRGTQEVRYHISGEADFGLIALPYSKAGSFGLPKLPEVSVQGLRVSRLTLTGAELALDLKVNNANAFPVRFNGLSYDLKLADAPLLRGTVSRALAVGAGGSGTLTLPLAFDYAQAGSVAQSLRSARTLPLELHAQVRVPGTKGEAVLPYSWKGAVPLAR